jgi:glutathione S-transferase
MMFYPDRYIGPSSRDQAHLRAMTRGRILEQMETLEANWRFDPASPCATDFYLAAMLRWVQLYPALEDKSWFRLSQYATLQASALALEARPSTAALQEAEGLGPTPFTAPCAPCPPQGSAT